MELFQVTTKIDNEFITIDLDLSTITEFGISCFKLGRKDGGFKKWGKRGYVVSNGYTYNCSIYKIDDLKKEFEGKIISRVKYAHIEQKYSVKGCYEGERKGVDWTYKIKTAL